MELPLGYLRAISRFEVYGLPDRFYAEVTQKTNLAFLAHENPRTLGQFTPTSYFWNRSLQHDVDYRAQQKRFFQTFAEDTGKAKGEEVLWVLKKESTSRARGITLLNAQSRLEELRRARVLNCAHVAQRYLRDPCLLPSAAFPGQGYKFDLRVYVVVVFDQSGVDGMSVYWYHEGFVRRCQELYQASAEGRSRSVHLTNSAVNAKDGDPELREYVRDLKKRLRFASTEEAFHLPVVCEEDSDDEGEIDSEDEELEFAKTMRLSDALKLLEQTKVTTKEGSDRICEDIHLLLEELFSCAAYASRPVVEIEKGKLEYQKHFAVLGVDIMLDSELKPWLIEINRYPDFRIYSMAQLDVKKQLVLDVLSLVFPECNAEDLVSVSDSLQADMLYDRLNPCFQGQCFPEEVLPTHTRAWKKLNVKVQP